MALVNYGMFPLAGLTAGCGVVYALAGKTDSRGWLRGALGCRAVAVLLASGIVVMGGMVTLRYLTWHSFVFDLGSYDQKVWLIARAPGWWAMWQQTYAGAVGRSPCGVDRFWGVCHFQPWLLIPGLIYKAWASPLVLLWLQVVLVASGVVPAFVLARDRLASPAAGFLAAALYLVYPAVQYNGVLDYRPDHIAIPALMWAYVFAYRGRYLASLGMAGLAALAKEPLILTAAFFGLYLATRHRQRVLGGAAFLVGLGAFYLVAFHLLRFGGISEGQFMIARYFPDMSQMGYGGTGGGISPLAALHRLTEPHKLLYLAGLLAPVALLPSLALPEMIPALPALVISLLSINPEHASIEAQYSAPVVAPVFASLVTAVAWLERRRIEQVQPTTVLAGLVALSAVLSLGVGPTVLSVKFWDPNWGGRWSGAQYRPERQHVLDRAVRLIPPDPKIVVVTQNDVNAPRLAHRFEFFAFPNALDRADYVLLDTGRQPYVFWTWDPPRYRSIVANLLRDPAYRVIFAEDGVLLLKRREIRRPQVARHTVAHAYGRAAR